ncbi:hypothetical protein BV898_16885 [Hypsibius exemplaris]|uniref:Uncharacterized protein n=1 Tax=Hypsibius exemplaris TaxID=2072580 RepID=A0A9X6RLH5_HYPEX|nr:hypothetical protein BV898_16885 [Hypsibius exemplaris]
MQENRSNRVFINEPIKSYEMLSNGENLVSGWDFINDDVVTVQLKKEQSFVEKNPTTNVILAAFTTCWSYAYLTNDGKHITKIKGFTLNGGTEDAENFAKITVFLLTYN